MGNSPSLPGPEGHAKTSTAAAKKKLTKAITRDCEFGRPPAELSNDFAEQNPAHDSRCEPICESAGPDDSDDCGFSCP